MSKNAGQN